MDGTWVIFAANASLPIEFSSFVITGAAGRNPVSIVLGH
jgi:hypothetical protein